jgi:hypothetical protein
MTQSIGQHRPRSDNDLHEIAAGHGPCSKSAATSHTLLEVDEKWLDRISRVEAFRTS